MTQQQLARRQERNSAETLVMAETDGGYRVYAAADPKRSYAVTGLPSDPSCTCADYVAHAADPIWRCKHILAVSERFFGDCGCADGYEQQERQAIQEEGQSPQHRRSTSPPAGNGATQLLLKRSMSPDGRIDSLSVEFSCPVNDLSVIEIRSKAKGVLGLQSAIFADFLESAPRNGNGNGRAPIANGNGHHHRNGSGGTEPNGAANSTVPATMVAIGGMDGKWGRRLFLVFDVDGTQSRLFGNRKQLVEAITGAGYLSLAVNIREGVNLNVPCRVATEPSSDGRFLNVVKVFPPAGRP